MYANGVYFRYDIYRNSRVHQGYPGIINRGRLCSTAEHLNLVSRAMKKEMFQELLKSIEEADQIIKGNTEASRRFEIKAPDIKSIRQTLGVSQAEFAFIIGVSIDTLQNWEQSRRQPQGPALALLTMFKNNPHQAFEILHRH